LRRESLDEDPSLRVHLHDFDVCSGAKLGGNPIVLIRGDPRSHRIEEHPTNSARIQEYGFRIDPLAYLPNAALQVNRLSRQHAK